jgi:lipoate-protein ligase A
VAWRLVETADGGAAWNMALDEAVAAAVRRGAAPPTVRFYGWTSPSVSIGCFQRARDVDLAFCERESIAVVRRPTGGRAVFHGRELTYSVSAPRGALMPSSLLGTYRALSAAFLAAFKLLGLEPSAHTGRRPSAERSPLCFASPSYGEVTLRGKKVVGSAQRRWPDGFLQQGSLPREVDRARTARVFRLSGEEAPPAGLCEVVPDVTPEALKDALRLGFEEVLGQALLPAPPTEEELKRARALEREKYLSPGWTLRR